MSSRRPGGPKLPTSRATASTRVAHRRFNAFDALRNRGLVGYCETQSAYLPQVLEKRSALSKIPWSRSSNANNYLKGF